jgi:hypothetical protein
MNRITAKVTQVNIGNLVLDGLMLEGQYGIAIPQVCNLFLVPQKNASRDIKALMGEGFSFFKWRSTLNSKEVNVLLLTDFEILVAKLDRAGNKKAQDFRDALVGLSLHQIFSDAFKVKFDEEDRQEWLKDRLNGKIARRSLTDAIKDYIERNSITGNTAKWMYLHVSETLNRLLFGMPAKKLCEKYHCPKDTLRDQFESKDIVNIRRLEEYTMQLIDKENTEPIQALTLAHEFWVKE